MEIGRKYSVFPLEGAAGFDSYEVSSGSTGVLEGFHLDEGLLLADIMISGQVVSFNPSNTRFEEVATVPTVIAGRSYRLRLKPGYSVDWAAPGDEYVGQIIRTDGKTTSEFDTGTDYVYVDHDHFFIEEIVAGNKNKSKSFRTDQVASVDLITSTNKDILTVWLDLANTTVPVKLEFTDRAAADKAYAKLLDSLYDDGLELVPGHKFVRKSLVSSIETHGKEHDILFLNCKASGPRKEVSIREAGRQYVDFKKTLISLVEI